MKRRNIILLAVSVTMAMSLLSTDSYIFAEEDISTSKENVEISGLDSSLAEFPENSNVDSLEVESTSSGICGDSVHWEFFPSKGKLVISGDGAMNNYDFPGVRKPWDRLSVDTLMIEEGVTEIGSYAFYYCENLKTVSFPSSLTRIGAFAFTGCNALTNIEIPSNVRTIEHSAFCYCRKIENLTINSDTIDVAPFAFGFCESLKTTVRTYIANERKFSPCVFYKEFNEKSTGSKTSE